ncbi:MAG: metallophosphoesterase family protein [Ardenticatenaceae bacterium]|nr:metallophosphoesterase family protein [Anaerolineales bacterium]MCB8916484.1 metallophosphoesterase family protein [Ardenticatenaceae bacterium]
MKILAVSDRVMSHLYSTQVRPNYPDVDLLISCGDLPFYYLEYLVSALDVPLLYVCGNHDTTPQYTTDGRMLKQVNGGCDIHGQVVFEKGLIFAGLEGSMRYRPHAPLMYTESEMNREISRLVPRLLWNWVRHGRALDVLVTHSPPYKVHDQPDIAHTGFKRFHQLVRVFRPRYLLHGHIHVYRQDVPRVTQLYDTLVINVYPYRLLNFYNPPKAQQAL